MPNDFDIASKMYDEVFTKSSIGIAQRHIVYKHINHILNSREQLNILEINCGTGADAIYMSKKGHRVLATDISKGMIEVANSKTNKSNIRFQVLDLKDIDSLISSKPYDLIFSNFGGLNCINKLEIERFLNSASKLLKPQGKLIMVVMPKHCLWEIVNFTIRGKFKQVFRRNTSSYVLANVDGVKVKTWYYNPKELIDIGRKWFQLTKLKPVGLSIPPSYLQNTLFGKSWVLGVLKRIEVVFNCAMFAKYADHYCIELQKK